MQKSIANIVIIGYIIDMDYKTAAETAVIWSKTRIITAHAVQVLCAKKRVPGATRWAGRWMVPADAADPRQERGWKKGRKRKTTINQGAQS